MAKTLLLISNRPDDREFATEAAVIAGLELKVVTDAKQGAQIISSDGADVIFADVTTEKEYQELETAIQDTVGLFSDKVSINHIHFISSDDLQKVKFSVQSPLFGNFIVRDYANTKDAGQSYGRFIKTSLQERAFGLESYLAPGAKLQVVKFKNTNQKQAGVEAVKNYLTAANFKSRMASVIANAVDEILMNAMFDAPIDNAGRPMYTSLSRNTALALEGKNAVEMHVGFDGNCVGVSVVDLFGSLDRGKLLAHVSKKYTDDVYKLKNIVAGAGIGLATIFSIGGSLLFVSENGVRTEAMVFFRKTDNFRVFKNQFRFLGAQFYF